MNMFSCTSLSKLTSTLTVIFITPIHCNGKEHGFAWLWFKYHSILWSNLCDLTKKSKNNFAAYDWFSQNRSLVVVFVVVVVVDRMLRSSSSSLSRS